MLIKTYLNTTKEEIDQKQYNIWIGISLGNKYFTKENIEQYIKWSLDHSKDGVLVVVGDSLHAINLEVLSTMSKESALAKAMKIGNEKHADLQSVIAALPLKSQKRIELLRWDQVTDSDQFRKNLEILKNEYKCNESFRNKIIQIVKDGRPDRQSTINKLKPNKLDRLADYILTELPILLNVIRSSKTGIIYAAIIYPGLSDLDYLKVGLNNKTDFPETANKLLIENKIAVLEGYPD